MSNFRVSSVSGSEKLSVLDSAGVTHTIEISSLVLGAMALAEKPVDTLIDDLTVDYQDMGKILVQTVDAKTLVLPAMAAGYAGMEFTYKNGGATDGAIILTISPNANDKIMGPDWAGVDNKDAINTKATAKIGDFMTLRGDGTNGWWIVAKRGTWVAE